MNTAKKEDFWFSVLNTTYLPSKVTAELYFENMEKKICRISFLAPRLGVYRLHCLQGKPDALSASEESALFEQLNIPKNAPFTVRFLSDLPIVVSHPEHRCVYQSSVI